MDLSVLIYRARKEKGLTQSAVAELLGMDRGNYGKLEKRGEKMTIEQLQSIAFVLGVPIGDLLEIENSTVKEFTERNKVLEEQLNVYKDAFRVAHEHIKLMKAPVENLARSVELQVTFEIILNAIRLGIITKEDCRGWFEFDRPVISGSEVTIPIDTDVESIEDNGYEYDDATISRVMNEKQIIQTLPSMSSGLFECLHALYASQLLKDQILHRSLHNYYNTWPQYRGNKRIG